MTITFTIPIFANRIAVALGGRLLWAIDHIVIDRKLNRHDLVDENTSGEDEMWSCVALGMDCDDRSGCENDDQSDNEAHRSGPVGGIGNHWSVILD